jgi:hypothetical protein
VVGSFFSDGFWIPCPCICIGNEFGVGEPRGLEKIDDEKFAGTTPGVKTGLNGLPNLDGIGLIRPPFDGILLESMGVLVDDPILVLTTRSSAGEVEECCESRQVKGGGHSGLRSWGSLHRVDLDLASISPSLDSRPFCS